MFEKEMSFFKQNQEKLFIQYPGKTLVIKGNEVIGVYSNPMEAYTETSKTNKPGSFMIQSCKKGPEAYSVTISTLGILRN